MINKHDFFLAKKRSTGIGTNLYLLGTSEDGPYMEPMLIASKTEATKVFGSADKGNLVKAFNEAYDRNKEISIFLVRITGKSATFELPGINYDTMEYETMLNFSSLYAGEKYNSVILSSGFHEELDCPVLNFDTPQGIFSYALTSYITLGELARLVNTDCRSGKHTVMITTKHPDVMAYEVIPYLYDEVQLEGGSDGIFDTRDEMYMACDIAYSILLGRPVDVIVPLEMYVDDVHPAYLYGESMYGSSFYAATRDYLQLVDTYNNDRVVSYHEQLIDFCREQTQLGFMSHGVIGFRPLVRVPVNVMNDNSYIMRILEATAFRDRYGFLEHINGYWVDKGFYVSVVASELVFHKDTPEEYFANGAVRYASMITGYYDGTSNMSIGEDVSLRYELSDATRADMSKIGIVSFRDSVRLGLVVQSGVTPALPETDYHTFANVRMVQLTIAYMNNAVQLVYEGEFNPEMRRTTLEELVRQRLEILADMQVLEDYNYSIQFLSDDSSGEILLTLKSKSTVEGIEITSAISNTGV